MYRSLAEPLQLTKEDIMRFIKGLQLKHKHNTIALLVSDDLLYTLYECMKESDQILSGKAEGNFDPSLAFFVNGIELIWCPKFRGAYVEVIKVLDKDYIERETNEST